MNRQLTLISAGIFCIAFLDGCFGKQEFAQQPSNVEVDPGDNVILECRVLKKQGKCMWQKDDKLQETFENKYQWHGNPDQGDCNLQIFNVNLTFDDANWKCLVTDSSWQASDALSSRHGKLVVRDPPTEPTIEFGTTQIQRGQNLTTVAGKTPMLKCSTRYGNPPSILHWYIGDTNVTEFARQANTSEVDHPKTWLSVSVLEYNITKKDHGKLLRCIAFHKSYEKKSKEITVLLNVQYPPSLVLRGEPRSDLEENKSFIKLECSVDSNPPSDIIWKRDGKDIEHFSTLEINSVNRKHSGSYTCEAKNSLGRNVTSAVKIDVKYPAKVIRVFPISILANVSDSTALHCLAEGNPLPKYNWLHSLTGDPDSAYVVDQSSDLKIINTSYKHQGKYVCIVTNLINSEERRWQSEEIKLNVQGPPREFSPVVNDEGMIKIIAEKGEDAKLEVQFCANPSPTAMSWEWGSLQLPVGEGSGGKYVARPLEQMKNVAGCYVASLIVQKSDQLDARRYIFNIHNDRGEYDIPVLLVVEDPISMTAVIAIVICGLVGVVFIVLLALYAFKSEKWCFRKKIRPVQGGDPENIHNRDKEEVDSNTDTGPGAIPPDALYTIPSKPRSTECVEQEASEYESMMGEQMDRSSNKNREIVYADLDIARHPNPPVHSLVSRRESPTEYARIQYRPQGHEKADI